MGLQLEDKESGKVRGLGKSGVLAKPVNLKRSLCPLILKSVLFLGLSVLERPWCSSGELDNLLDDVVL